MRLAETKKGEFGNDNSVFYKNEQSCSEKSGLSSNYREDKRPTRRQMNEHGFHFSVKSVRYDAIKTPQRSTTTNESKKRNEPYIVEMAETAGETMEM